MESRGSKTLGFGLGAYVGVLPNFGLKAASPRFEMNLELKVLRVIRLGALVGYFPASKAGVDETVDPKQVVTVRQADFSFNVIPLLFRAAYQQPVGPIDLYGGGMIGVAFVSGKAVAVQSRTEASIEETPLNAAVFLGTGLTLGPGQVVLELRWSWLSLDYSDDVIDLSNEPGKLGGLSGALGYKLEF
ncbi:MAG: hypothetical protein HY901_14895 [Deltaproteobacteria bacterium]|nr:hypothetical protein [Deltaproteobacteria bacterium]